VGRDRGRPSHRGAPRPAAGRGPAGTRGLGRQDHLRPPQPGVLEPRARPARRGPCRQGRPVEGPAPMSAAVPGGTPTTGDLLYSDIEDDLRASVRGLVDKQAPWDTVLAR